MERNHVIFGYSTEDIVRDINIASKEVTGRVNPKSIKSLVKRPSARKAIYNNKKVK